MGWSAAPLADSPFCMAHLAGSPSRVVTSLPAAAATVVTQERISLPSSSTEQAPHCARPQPNCGPDSSRSFRKTYRSGVSVGALISRRTPLTTIIAMKSLLQCGYCQFPFSLSKPVRGVVDQFALVGQASTPAAGLQARLVEDHHAPILKIPRAVPTTSGPTPPTSPNPHAMYGPREVTKMTDKQLQAARINGAKSH